MAAQKWYTQDDIELAKSALSELPDLTEKRLTKSAVLDSLKAQIIELADKKGYSADDIKIALDAAGIVVSVKMLREIITSRKTTRKKTAKVTVSQKAPETAGDTNAE